MLTSIVYINSKKDPRKLHPQRRTQKATKRAVKMACPRLLVILSISLFVALFPNSYYCSPVEIAPESVPDALVKSAIDSLNADSPTQHTYKGGNLINAQKLLEPNRIVYRLTLNLETICEVGSSNCPREACTIALKVRSEAIEVDRNSIQCMYLYPQSVMVEVESMQQTEGVAQKDQASSVHGANPTFDDDRDDESSVKNRVELDHEVQATVGNQRLDVESVDNEPFIAVRAPNSNYCAGCPYELNPNLPGLTAFNVQALDMMDRLGQGEFKHKLIRILKITRAVPAGSNVVQYKLLAEIGESNCLKATLIDRSECSIQSNIPTRVCLVTFEERPWQQSDRQVTGNNCTVPSDLENEINASLGVGLAVGNTERVDSVQEVIGKTAHIDQLAQEGKIGTYDSLLDEILENPVHNATQDTAPVTEIHFFEGVVQSEDGSRRTEGLLLQHDEKKHVVQFQQERDPSREAIENRPVVTAVPYSKAEVKQDENRATVHGFVDKLKEFDDFLSDFDIPLKRDEVVEESGNNRQIVTEDIIRPQRVDRERTARQESTYTGSSSSKKSKDRQGYTVGTQRKKRGLVSTRDSEMLLVKNLAQKAVSTLDEIDQDNEKRVVLSVVESKKEEVDGFLYHLILEIASTDCQEEEMDGSDNNCLGQISGPVRICKVQIHTDDKNQLLSARVVNSECWRRTRRNKRRRRSTGFVESFAEISINKFNRKSKRSVKEKSHSRNLRKRQAVGNPSAISVNDPKVQNYVVLGLREYASTFRGPNEPVVAKIKNATVQIVQGTLYKIRVLFGSSNCMKGNTENCQLQAGSPTKECEVKAWSRPWLSQDALQITVNCNINSRRKRMLKGMNYSQKMLEQSLHMKNERLFNEFLTRYNKSYSSTLERKYRLKIFEQNMMMVQELQRNEQGTAIYGASMFADLTTEEFKKKYLGLRPELRFDNEIPIPMAEIPNITIPDEYDWRNFNVVTPVKNQGSCGSCWAFSVTGNVEGQYALRRGSLLSLSEQELVDCDTLDEGCNGGLPDNAYRAIEKLGGLELETDYPYEGEGETCRFDQNDVKVKVVSAVNITTNETQMAQWLVQNGPISIGINANAMQFYMGGVSHPYKFLCSPSNLDHGVLIVGYGEHTYPIFHKILPFWTIKNSWGPLWGEQGYYRVYRGDGTCGVNQMASSAVVA